MTTRTIVSIVIAALAAAAVTAQASADYRVRLFACSVGVPGADIVPANTPLYVDGGWTTGTRGLLRDAINDSVSTVTDTREGVTTNRPLHWGPIAQDNLIFDGSWTANWRAELPPLAVGERATVTRTLAWAHPLVDLGLPTTASQAGLLYFDLQPADTLAFANNPVTCTITGA